MNKNDVIQLFKNNVIDWYDFNKDSSIKYLNLNEKNIDQNYDYIVINDAFEIIDEAIKHLNENGTIILLLNNKFGISNFITENGFKKNIVSYSKFEIEQKLKSLNLQYKFFYPLPNKELANTIFSDDYLPQLNNTKINNNNLYDGMVYINELNAIKNIIKNGKFKEFTNSYFIEINPKTNIKFASFNNTRNEENRVCTRIYNEFVEKNPISEKSKVHINEIKENIDELKKLGFNVIDKYENEKIVSPFITEKLFYQVVLECFYDNKIDDAILLIKKWYDYINDKLQNSTKKYIDLTMENVFYINGEFEFFDQEWAEENIPNEFILYRSINNLYNYNNEIAQIISEEDLLSKFNILEKREEFDKLERQFQKGKVDEEICKMFNDYISLPNKLEEYISEDKRKEIYIKNLTTEIEKFATEIEKHIEAQNSLRKDIENLMLSNKQLNELNIELNEKLVSLTNQILQKEDTIKYYQNMKLVKLTNKMRERKNKK